MKISVIAPSYLGNYQGAATDRERKFIRAVTSFLQQQYSNKELVIISDGCEITNRIIEERFPHDGIKLIKIPKQDLFSGQVRNAGVQQATGDVITYLDSDDHYGNSLHLDFIYNAFLNPQVNWIYFDDIVQWNPHVSSPRESALERGRVGTSNIAHRNIKEISWNGMNGYGHDWSFITQLMQKYPNPPKISGTSYTVCHIPNVVDV
jgi:glycosyltransferase involved in cell wall biosynthesis